MAYKESYDQINHSSSLHFPVKNDYEVRPSAKDPFFQYGEPN
uniref:Uncharacterized protein n=1 Tax=Arundo donax TaxID=35708 RepID=A0A0A9BU86_ARUDO